MYIHICNQLSFRARLRERENENLENLNERLLAQIRDLRQHLQEQEEVRERRLVCLRLGAAVKEEWDGFGCMNGM